MKRRFCTSWQYEVYRLEWNEKILPKIPWLVCKSYPSLEEFFAWWRGWFGNSFLGSGNALKWTLYYYWSFCINFNVARFFKYASARPRTNFHKTLVIIVTSPMLKSSFRCSGSRIDISIMKSVANHQGEWFLIYDHHDLSYLDIENFFLKNMIFCVDFSWKLAFKNSLKEILKEIGKENEIKKKFIEFRFLI